MKICGITSEEDALLAVAAGRLAVGPWYVQPDSLLPSGEAHVRNLLEGRRVARSIGAWLAIRRWMPFRVMP